MTGMVGLAPCYHSPRAIPAGWWMVPEPGSPEYRIAARMAARLYWSWRARLDELHALVDEQDILQHILQAWDRTYAPILKPAGFAYRCGRFFVIDHLRKAKPLRRPEGGGPAKLRSIDEEFDGDGMVPAPEVQESEEMEVTAEEWLFFASRCTKTEKLIYLLKTLPRYGEDERYLRACADVLAEANEIPVEFALSTLTQVVAEERARQTKRPGKRYGEMSAKAIQGLFLPTYRPAIRAINTALSRARDRVAPERPKQKSWRGIRRSALPKPEDSREFEE